MGDAEVQHQRHRARRVRKVFFTMKRKGECVEVVCYETCEGTCCELRTPCERSCFVKVSQTGNAVKICTVGKTCTSIER